MFYKIVGKLTIDLFIIGVSFCAGAYWMVEDEESYDKIKLANTAAKIKRKHYDK